MLSLQADFLISPAHTGMLSFQADGGGQRASPGSAFSSSEDAAPPRGAVSPTSTCCCPRPLVGVFPLWMPRSGLPAHLTRLSMSVSGSRRFSCPAFLIPGSPSGAL